MNAKFETYHVERTPRAPLLRADVERTSHAPLPRAGIEQTPNTPLLRADGVTLQYATRQSVTTATYRVSFEVRRGDLFAVMGHSGCGKSTILNAIAGNLHPVEGTLLLNNKSISGPGPERMVVWQSHDQLLPWKTVLENVAYPLILNGKATAQVARAKATQWLETVGLARALNQFPHQLSGLCFEPEILLMDEPFAALDALNRAHMQDELKELQSRTGTTILLVTHDIAEAVRVASRILVLSPHTGQVKAEVKLMLNA